MNSSPSIAGRLAQRIAAFSPAEITAHARQRSVACILDTIGVALAGSQEPCTRILQRVRGVAPAGSCLLWGSTTRTSALDATLVNGTAAHALDYDDFSAVMGGHHSVTLLPMLIALGEERGASGASLLAAYVLGVEVEIRFARAVGFHHYDKGWHPTSTLGVFGATAAASLVLGLNARQIATALGIAASHAAGMKANFGTMIKPLHVGQCGRNGLLAALLAQEGFDAADDVFEHHQGFFNVFNGPGTFDAEQIFAHWCDPLEIGAPSIGLKQFPCCGSTHPAVTMALRLAREEKIDVRAIGKIEILPHARRLRHTDNPAPASGLEAKFSVQYVVARALRGKPPKLADFEESAIGDPEVARLLGITEAKPHPDMRDDAKEQWGAEVILHMRDGRRLSRRIDNLVGRGGDNAMTHDELFEKFEDCAKTCLPAKQIDRLFGRLLEFDRIEDVRELTHLLQPPTTI